MGVRSAVAVTTAPFVATRIAIAVEPSAADKERSCALFAQGTAALDAHDHAGVPSVNVGSWSLAAGVGAA
jgi:hypothetical protein